MVLFPPVTEEVARLQGSAILDIQKTGYLGIAITKGNPALRALVKDAASLRKEEAGTTAGLGTLKTLC